MSEALPYVAIIFSGITLLILVAEKLFGGGNALANKFHALERDTRKEIAVVRNDLTDRVDSYERAATGGFDAMRTNMEIMRTGLLEFRAKVAEDLHMYIRKDDYNSGISDIKRDVKEGFEHVDERLGQMHELILKVIPERKHA